MLQIDSSGSPLVQVPVRLTTASGPGDPSGDTVEMAFLTGTGKPAAGDWHTAGWVSTAVGGWKAQIQLGSGGAVTLTPGYYYWWVRVTDPLETVVECVGMLEVT